MLLLSLAGCGKGGAGNNSDNQAQTEKTATRPSESGQVQNKKDGNQGENILIAYFTWAENAQQDNIDAMTSPSVKAPGDVAQLASWISEQTGGRLFSIQVTEPYPADWDSCLERANEEKNKRTYPVLAKTAGNLENYDTIFLGYPNWWYSCPMAIHSFLRENDLSGKQVYLFCSHGTGGLASSVEDITADLPDAKISENVFDVYEEDAASAKGQIQQWIAQLGLK